MRLTPARIAVIASVLLWSETGAAASTSPLRVVDLRTENQVNPIGIEEGVPLLAWKLDVSSARKPQDQHAYQIRVAPNAAALRKGGEGAWDSGKVISSTQSEIALNSIELRSREAFAWQVRVWDEADRASDWSAPATFEMGLLDPGDWTARWIENAAYHYTQPNGAEMPLPVFLKKFRVDGTVFRARLYLTGLGQYAMTLNGRPVSNHVLEPGQTTYAAEVSYRTYDLTRKLKRGDNVLRVETGSGAYQRAVTPGSYFFGGALERHVTYGEPKIIAQLEIA